MMINQFPDVVDAPFVVEAGPRFGQTVVATGAVIRLKYISLHILQTYTSNSAIYTILTYTQYNLNTRNIFPSFYLLSCTREKEKRVYCREKKYVRLYVVCAMVDYKKIIKKYIM